MTLAEEIHGLQVGKSGRPDLALVWPVRPVRDEEHTEFAFRSFHCNVDFAGRNVKALGVKLEVVN
jgi:hypothetical protein